MINLSHLADVHLERKLNNCSYPSKFAKERRLEAWLSLSRLLSSENSDFILIVGDLFESQYFTQGNLYKLYDIFSNHPDKNIIICPGNHDPIGSYSKEYLPTNVKVFNKDSLDYFEFIEKRTRIYGVAWDKSYYNEINFDVYLDKSFINILCLHSDLYSDSGYMYMNPSKLESIGFDYIALGHIHKADKILDNIYYSGSFEPMDFGDLGEKGFLRVNLDKSYRDIEFVDFSFRKFIQNDLILSPDMNENDLLNNIKSLSTSKDFQRINLKGKLNEKTYKMLDWIKKISESNFYYVEFIEEELFLDNSAYLKENKAVSQLINNISESEEKEMIKTKAIQKVLSLVIEVGNETNIK